MGKGFQNFMSKKTFHPGSYQNQKRVQEAEAAAEAKRKHDEETLAQYLKEQELFQQQSLVSRESKDKLSLSFMYTAPPGTSSKKDEKDTGDDDDDLMMRTSMKWNKEVKQESSSKSFKGPVKPTDHRGGGDGDEDDDDGPRIVLKWRRTELKSKNRRPEPQVKAAPDGKATKKEEADIKVPVKLEQSEHLKPVKRER